MVFSFGDFRAADGEAAVPPEKERGKKVLQRLYGRVRGLADRSEESQKKRP
ncbi:MAG: hypothetical protein QGH15_17915 [Kiritimatiellia bacterium]|nr:hypothetical protein [Kiritimatiellia bacterium]